MEETCPYSLNLGKPWEASVNNNNSETVITTIICKAPSSDDSTGRCLAQCEPSACCRCCHNCYLICARLWSLQDEVVILFVIFTDEETEAEVKWFARGHCVVSTGARCECVSSCSGSQSPFPSLVSLATPLYLTPCHSSSLRASAGETVFPPLNQPKGKFLNSKIQSS